MKKIYNKLVRDKIPEIIRADDAEPTVRELDEQDYIVALKDKFTEEVEEMLETKNGEELLEELADIYELIRTLSAVKDSSIKEIERSAKEKRRLRGGFQERIFLETVEE